MTVLSNRKNSSALLHFTASNTVTIYGNSSASAIAKGDEFIAGADIRAVAWSGNWTVSRGSNNYLTLTNTGILELSVADMAITADANATLVANLVSGSGFIMLKVGKNNTGPSEY